MPAPKSILKNRAPGPVAPVAGPSKLTGSKLRQSITSSELRRSVNAQRRGARAKRRGEGDGDEDDEDEGGEDDDEASGDGNDFGDGGGDEMGGEGDGEASASDEPGTDEEIERAKRGGEKDRSGQKRKRPTTASEFGNTLTSLLAPVSDPPASARLSKQAKKVKSTARPTASAPPTVAAASVAAAAVVGAPQHPGSAILSLSRARPPPSAAADRLARQAARRLKVEKAEKEDKARVTDIVEGWAADPRLAMGGMEFERSLRKTAQRGVLKLFNAILVASKNAEAANTSLSAKAGVKDETGKRKEKDNVLGRGGKEAALTKESFLDLVRRG